MPLRDVLTLKLFWKCTLDFVNVWENHLPVIYEKEKSFYTTLKKFDAVAFNSYMIYNFNKWNI